MRSFQAKRTAIGDKTLTALRDCQALVDLHVQGTNVTAKGVQELRLALPKCRTETDLGTVEPKAK